MSLSPLQMPKIELHRPGIEPGPPALQLYIGVKRGTPCRERGGEQEPKGGMGPEEGWVAMRRPSFTWLEEWLSSRSLRALDI